MGNIHGKFWTVHLLKEEKKVFLSHLSVSLALASPTHLPAFYHQFTQLEKIAGLRPWLQCRYFSTSRID